MDEVYGEGCTSRARVFDWHKRFCTAREDVNDDNKSDGRPVTYLKNGNVEEIHRIRRILVNGQSINIIIPRHFLN